MTKTALFFNFTNEPFTGYWDGKEKTFKAGEQRYMPEWLARHYAKHLTNQELLKLGHETSTSPKFQEQVPKFMEIFNKCFIMPEDAVEQDDASSATDIADRTHREPSMNISEQPKKTADAITLSVPDEDDDENFQKSTGEEEND